jgi:hypothetical protein
LEIGSKLLDALGFAKCGLTMGPVIGFTIVEQGKFYTGCLLAATSPPKQQTLNLLAK